jgi:hypothetical protein
VSRQNETKSRSEMLAAEGWSKQFVANEPRLSEAIEMYKEAGFEVHLEPLPKGSECESCTGDEEGRGCRVCFEGFEDQYRIIFTRPIKGKTGREADLF